MKYEYLSWGANALSFILFIYLFLKYNQSTCFNAFETFLSLGTLMLSVFSQFLSVVLRETSEE